MRTDKAMSADKGQGSEFSKKVTPYKPEMTVCVCVLGHLCLPACTYTCVCMHGIGINIKHRVKLKSIPTIPKTILSRSDF